MIASLPVPRLVRLPHLTQHRVQLEKTRTTDRLLHCKRQVSSISRLTGSLCMCLCVCLCMCMCLCMSLHNEEFTVYRVLLCTCTLVVLSTNCVKSTLTATGSSLSPLLLSLSLS
eukprot:scpid111747/ scgid26937/ 